MKLKVLVTLNDMRIGGSQTYVVALINELKARGHTTVVASGKGEMVRNLEKIDVKHYEANLLALSIDINQFRYGKRQKKDMLRVFRFLFVLTSSIIQILNVVKKERINIIHTMQPGPILVSSFVSKVTGIPLVATVHGPGSHEFPLHGFKFEGIGSRIKRVIAISQEVKQYLVDSCGVDEKKIVIVPNGVDLKNFHPFICKKDLKLKKILYVSGGYHLSSATSLINATPEITRRVPNIKVIIVGEGPKFDEITKLAKKINNQLKHETIIITGMKSSNDMPEIMNSIDVMIGVGRSALEAMACGKPTVIAGKTKFGGIVTKNNITDLKMHNFSGRNSSERTTSTRIAKSVLKLLTSKEYRESIESFGREIIEREFDIKKVAEQIENVYLSTLRT
jgi:glycosyltransferase involved in cell wall biosynthesis